MALRFTFVVLFFIQFTLSQSITAKVVAIAKALPICLYPKYKKGKFIKIKNAPKGSPVIALSIIETPTTPPSIILLGIKNISNPITH